jgi:hypothetical protein
MTGLAVTAHGGEDWKITPETPETPGKLSETLKNARCFSGVSPQLTPGTPVGASVSALLGTLEGLGVSISATPDGNLRIEPAALVVPELLEEIRRHKTELLNGLRSASPAPLLGSSGHEQQQLPRLPGPVASMVAAAASDQIKGGAVLPSGLVTDLSGYVLAWAAAYLTGEQAQALAHLTEARSAWRPA